MALLATALAALIAATPVPPVAAVTPDHETGTLPPGSVLPSGDECAARVHRTGWEPRPENDAHNQTRGWAGVRIDGASDAFNAAFAWRVDGDFAGTTDEIIQWGACKWGLDEDVVRAVAVQESWWKQSTVIDAQVGLLQVKTTVHLGTDPLAWESTAFNVDYALAWRRACFEGDFTWMPGGYRAGDEWGCVGAWFSGRWYDGEPGHHHSGARWYIEEVREHLAARTWQSGGF